jgi:hypothetical protein
MPMTPLLWLAPPACFDMNWPSLLPSCLQASATYATTNIKRGASYLTPAEATASPVTISPGLKKR